jgi:hypothetical protein
MWRKEHSRNLSKISGEVVIAGTPKNDAAAATAAIEDESPNRRSSLRKSLRKVANALGAAGMSSHSDGLDELGIEFSEKNMEELGRNVQINRGLSVR